MTEAGGLKRWHTALMSFSTGLIVANIYYCQPLIVHISREFGVTNTRAGVITFLTQIGYAIGLFFFVPLGDKFERKKQILVTTALVIAVLLVAAAAPTLFVLEVASLLIGAFCIIPQLILPLGATLAAPERRGKVIGSIMSGLLVGILLSRTVSGLVGDWLGWRGMFYLAAGISTLLLILMQAAFPRSKPNFKGSYATLMRTLVHLFREQPVLREAAFINALAFACFGMFWTCLVLHLSASPFHYSSNRIGLFGLAAAAGALAAPLVGAVADKKNPRVAIGYGLVIVLVSFGIFQLFSVAVWGIIAGIVLLDLGLQCIHVSNQTRVYALDPAARNRLNTLFMTISFLGTSMGSAVGLAVWDRYAWTGICVAGGVMASAALVIYGLTWRKPTAVNFKAA